MTHPLSTTRMQREIQAALAAVPAGYVTTAGDIGRHLAIQTRHVEHILAGLDETDRTTPWWRVVADGGAVGRHTRRDAQIALLRSDGVPLSPAGIVQELVDRRVKNLTSPPAAAFAHPLTQPGAQPTRSRGMKSHAVIPRTPK